MPALIVHGGCGAVSAEEQGARKDACESAADAGWEVILDGGSALDAAEAAVCSLEDNPLLNVGTGSYLQADGVARMDASVMTGDGRAGAVAQVPGLKNPVRLARYILEQEAHVMISGPSALELGLKVGFEAAVVATPKKIEYWERHLDEASRRLDYASMAAQWKRENPRLGTVGCVALDKRRDLAAATSTGGTGHCYPGRVGDTPIIGAGTYCTKKAAVSMTGLGERIMVLLSAKRLCDLVDGGKPLEEAARVVLAELAKLTPASAGVIAIDASGETSVLWDTPFMAYAMRP